MTCFISINAFYWIAFYVQFHRAIPLEQVWLTDLHQYHLSWLTHLARAVCTSVTTISVTILLYLLYRRYWHHALFWFCTSAGAAIVAGIAKRAVQRTRPELWKVLSPQATFGFPSGHATESMAICVALLFLLKSSRHRAMLVPVAIVFIGTVGLCRLYLGLHYPTDIAAGWMLAVAWVSAVAILFDAFDAERMFQTKMI